MGAFGLLRTPTIGVKTHTECSQKVPLFLQVSNSEKKKSNNKISLIVNQLDFLIHSAVIVSLSPLSSWCF